MNSFMNITVRVNAAAGMAQLQAMRARIAELEGQLNASGGAAAAFGASAKGAAAGAAALGTGAEGATGKLATMRASLIATSSAMTASGSRIQWLGRQLQSNFTVPILLAAGAATKFALDNEKAFVRMTKVYGDLSISNQVIINETNALRGAFVALSNQFGVQQKDVLNIAADWAAAGASGVALAKSVETTLKVMILGEMGAADATKALIAIQAQYGASSSQLISIIEALNAVENQTGVSMSGLIDAFERTAGVAKTAGIDYQHLSAMIAALVPASGGAAQAGNALKTIISRLASPTEDAAGVLGLMGINIADVAWKSANGTQKLEILAQKFHDLDSATKLSVASTIASRWQINKFTILMDQLYPAIDNNARTTSYYTKALDTLSIKNAAATISAKELKAVLDSNPQRLKQLGVMIQNVMADAIQPLIPVLLGLVYSIQQAFTWFGNLNPTVQKTVIIMLLMLAVIGPLVRYFGSLKSLIGLMIPLFLNLGSAMLWLAMVPARLIAFAFTGLFAVIAALPGIIAGAVAAIPVIMTALIAELTGAWSLIVSVFTIGATMLPIILARAEMVLQAVWTALWGALAALGRMAWAAITVGWELFLMGLSAIQIAFTGGLITIWEAMWAGITLIVGTGGTIITGLWAAMLAFWNRMTVLFALNWSAIWRSIVTFMEGLVPIFEAIGSAIIFALTTPWVIAIAIGLAAITAIIVAFHDQIGQLFVNLGKLILKAFYALPTGVQDALMQVVKIVQKAAMAIYDLFQYMNPFAHHSPSLVENVQGGMQTVSGHVQAVPAAIAPATQQAHDNIHQIGQAAQAVPAATQAAAKAVTSSPVSSAPAKAATASYKELTAAVKLARVEQASLNAAITKQQAVVDALKASIDKYDAAISAAKDVMDKFANAPIKGEKALNDQIFSNTMAQKALQLQMMKMQDAVGPIDKLQSKMSALAGQMEALSGDKAGLLSAGAGSDITGPIDAQIAALKSQSVAIGNQLQPIQALQDQLDALGRKGQELDLTKSLQFDPLHKQIDDVVTAAKELDFATIINGVKGQRAQIDALTGSRDALQKQYDSENAKLATMKSRYDSITDSIKIMNAAIGATPQGKKDAAAHQTPGMKSFTASQGGNFPDVGGSSIVGREGAPTDQSAQIAKFTKDIQTQTASAFASLNPFQPFIDGWNNTIAWLKTNVGGGIKQIGDAVSSSFSGSGGFGALAQFFQSISGPAKTFIDLVVNIGKTVWQWLGAAWNLIKPLIKDTIGQLWIALQAAWVQMQPAFKSINDAWNSFILAMKPVMEQLARVWEMLKPVLGVILIVIGAIVAAVWGMLNGAIGPVFHIIVAIITGVIQVISGVIQIVFGLITVIFGLLKGIFTGDWGTFLDGFKAIWNGILSIISGITTQIQGIIIGFIQLVIGLVSGFIKGIVGFFQWLFDTLVGHSIVPDLINGIIGFFQMMWTAVEIIWNAFVGAIKWVGDMLMGFLTGVIQVVILAIQLWFQGMQLVIAAVWNAVVGAIQGAWNFIQYIFALIKFGIILVQIGFQIFMSKVSAIWQGFKNMLSTVWNWIRDNIFGNIKTFMTVTIPNAFKTAVDNIGKLWAGIKELVAAPLRFIITTVYNKGILPVWNAVAGYVGGKQLTPITKLAFADGGIMPGYTPGRDVHTVSSNRGPVALSGGEAIMRPEWTKAVGPGFVNFMNGLAKHGGVGAVRDAMNPVGHFADGGIWGGLGNVANGALGVIKKGGDILSQAAESGFEGVAKKVLSPIRTKLAQIGAVNGLNSVMTGYPIKVIDSITSFLKKKDASFLVSGSGIGGRALRAAQSQLGVPYVFGAESPGHAFDCSGLTQWSYKQAGVTIPRLAHLQQNMADNVPPATAIPGDLVFFGHPAEHVGMWVAKNKMINAPHDGVPVQYDNFGGGYNASNIGRPYKLSQSINAGMQGPISPTGTAQQIAMKYLAQYGWQNQFPALNQIYNHESGWNVHSLNRTSGAYGIPQALPASKMASAGSDWHDSAATQIRWGLSYIKSRYGSPNNAWSFWQNHNWYDDGGWMKSGSTGSNTSGKPEPVFTNDQWQILGRAVNNSFFNSGVGGTSGTATRGRMDAAVARMNPSMTGGSGSSGGTVININGNLSFPNIKNGDDAHDFLSNLEAIARK